MATIVVSDTDVQIAEDFIATYLTEKVPDGDFSPGSALRDLVVKAIAYIFAFFEKERTTIKDRQSLLKISELGSADDVSDATLALLSNWFLSPNEGSKSRVAATLHFSKASDVVLTTTTKFNRTSALTFVPDSTGTFIIPAATLSPIINSDGTIKEYVTTITLIAQQVGSSYNITPGRFTSADVFNVYFTYAENVSEGYDGKSTETATELLARAPTAISTRNLVNTRSIDTVLKDTFSTLSRETTTGFGDSEMIRDLSQEPWLGLPLHLGGSSDTYVQLPRTEVIEVLPIGGIFTRPDGVACVFKDSVVDFLSSGVVAGHILRVVGGLRRVPREYVITDVLQHSVTISSKYPFAEITDEYSPETYVTYSIGTLSPTYNDIVVTSATGQTSRKIQQDNTVVLLGQPHYRIKRVEVLAPDSSITATLSTRVNKVSDITIDSYVITCVNPDSAQSSKDLSIIEVDSSYNTLDLRVIYETIAGYLDVQTLLTNPFERVICAKPLAKAYNPVYVSLLLTYVPIGIFDVTAATEFLAQYVNNFNPTQEPLDIATLLQQLRNNFPTVGAIYDPIQLGYTLIAPDGQQYVYETKDVITLTLNSETSHARLINGLSLRIPISNLDLDSSIAINKPLFNEAALVLGDQLTDIGVSDRNIRVMTDTSLISLQVRA